MIDKPQIRLMKPTAIIINTARGPIINEHALVDALVNKQILGAGLDVFEHEPKISRRLEQLSNVVLSPHIGSATHEARFMMSEIVAKNVISVFTTGKAINPAM
jgi:lactate dehydrogenase-like 2-hydroxyacid dehydrogenase